MVFLFLKLSTKLKQVLLLIGVFLLLATTGLLYQYSESNFVRNVVLHDNPETGGKISSNDERVAAWGNGLNDVADDPLLGCGPGCAGPASFHHEDGARISENQYIQAAQEMGVVGLILLIIIFVLTARRVITNQSELSAVLIASFISISLAGVFMHSWADDIVGYSWWITAGLLLKNNEKERILKKS